MPSSIALKKRFYRFTRTLGLSLVFALLLMNTPTQSSLPVGSELEIITGEKSWIRNPDVGMAASGGFFVVWMGENFNVFGRRFDHWGVPYGSEFQINTTTQNNTQYPRIAMNSAGSSVVVWTSSNRVMGQRFDHLGNAVGLEFEAYADSSHMQYSPSVSMDLVGNFAIAWVCQYTGWPQYYTTILCRRFDASAVPVGSHFEVNDVGLSSTEDRCELSMNDSGEFIIVWESSLGRQFQRYNSSGIPVGVNVQMDTDMLGTGPTVAMNNAGDFVIAWITRHDDGSERGIAAQRYGSTGAEISSDFQVNTYTYLNQEYPTVAMDNEGNFSVVWQSQQEDTINTWDSMGIYGQQYDAAGGMIGSEMHVNTHEDGRQDTPRIAMIDGNKFVVVWDSGPMSGTEHAGIYAQLYSPDATAIADHVPSVFLSQNFPNPFNPSTTIRFSLDRAEAVTLMIYNSTGHHIRTLINSRIAPGSYSKDWNGNNQSGHTVASGIYFYRLRAGNFINTKKMVFLK